MKKTTMMLAIALLVCASVAVAQTYVQGNGITGIDKLGAHQNGGRGCVGCHTPHSGARGNGGTLKWDASANNGSGGFVSVATVGDSGDDALWGQDIGPVVGLGSIATGTGGAYGVGVATGDLTSHPRVKTGVVFCLSCHDGNVAKGAMMTNQSFEQVAGLLPTGYGTQAIPTLLGNDGGSTGNYENDHPIGTAATVGALGSLTGTNKVYVALDANKTRLVSGPNFAGSAYSAFRDHYGLPTVIGSRTGAGFAVEGTMASANDAYVVCTTCHTPHSMYTTSAGGVSTSVPDGNPIATATSGTFPTYFFIAAPYNPGANTANGTKASSATQFCRQCHFTGAGGSNEGSGIMNVSTAF